MAVLRHGLVENVQMAHGVVEMNDDRFTTWIGGECTDGSRCGGDE